MGCSPLKEQAKPLITTIWKIKISSKEHSRPSTREPWEDPSSHYLPPLWEQVSSTCPIALTKSESFSTFYISWLLVSSVTLGCILFQDWSTASKLNPIVKCASKPTEKSSENSLKYVWSSTLGELQYVSRSFLQNLCYNFLLMYLTWISTNFGKSSNTPPQVTH